MSDASNKTQGSSIWVVAYNHDYNEYSRAFNDPRLAAIDIAREFNITAVISRAGAKEAFWDRINEEYEANSWKGLTVHSLDPESLEMVKRAPEEMQFTLAELSEADPDFAITPPAP